MLYSSLYQFHESFKQGQIREESIQQILNHMMEDVKSCSSLSIDPIVIYSMTSYYSNQCSSTSTEESGQKDRFVDSSPNNVCSPLLSSLSNDLLSPQLIHSFLLANQNVFLFYRLLMVLECIVCLYLCHLLWNGQQKWFFVFSSFLLRI